MNPNAYQLATAIISESRRQPRDDSKVEMLTRDLFGMVSVEVGQEMITQALKERLDRFNRVSVIGGLP